MTIEILDPDADSGLLVDTAGAARNRRNIERMRQSEGNPYHTANRFKSVFRSKETKVEKELSMVVTEKPGTIQAKHHYNETGISKYDDLIPIALTDLPVMPNHEFEVKHGIKKNCLSNTLKVWRKHGMIPADFVTLTEKKRMKPAKGKLKERTEKTVTTTASAAAPVIITILAPQVDPDPPKPRLFGHTATKVTESGYLCPGCGQPIKVVPITGWFRVRQNHHCPECSEK